MECLGSNKTIRVLSPERIKCGSCQFVPIGDVEFSSWAGLAKIPEHEEFTKSDKYNLEQFNLDSRLIALKIALGNDSLTFADL